MTVFELGEDIIVVDAGLAFPRDEHLGVDLVLPDFGYLQDRADRVRAVVLTHGHEDHVGGLPYFLREVKVPEVWATKLTLELVASKLDEHGLLSSTELRELVPEDGPVQIGPFRVDGIRMAHSIPDSVALVIESESGSNRPHGRLQDRPHAGRRDQDRRGQARRGRKPRRRPAPRRLDQRGAARCDPVGARRRRGLPPAHPRANGARAHFLVRLERPPHAAGDRRGRADGAQGRRRRPLDCARTSTSRATSATSTSPTTR